MNSSGAPPDQPCRGGSYTRLDDNSLARVERRETVRVTVRGKVIAEIVPPRAEPDQAETARARLRGSVVRYDAPFEPVVPPEEWEANR